MDVPEIGCKAAGMPVVPRFFRRQGPEVLIVSPRSFKPISLPPGKKKSVSFFASQPVKLGGTLRIVA